MLNCDGLGIYKEALTVDRRPCAILSLLSSCFSLNLVVRDSLSPPGERYV